MAKHAPATKMEYSFVARSTLAVAKYALAVAKYSLATAINLKKEAQSLF
jgi:hypothetical protein